MQTASVVKRVIALIEDDLIMGESLVQRLELEGCSVFWWKTGDEALHGLAKVTPDIVISDIRLPDLSGEEIFHRALPFLGSIPVIFITAFSDIDQAVRLMRAGAGDYITKPFVMSDFLSRVDELLSRSHRTVSGVLGVSQAMQGVERILQRAASIDSSVLLTGESGVGKEVAAHFLHKVSPYSDRPFVAVNCAAIPPTLLESELFGHERGAFTDAKKRHLGYLERARDGVLFLDEIAELPLDMQAKLLRVLQERSFNRIGGDEEIAFNARLICATNSNVQKSVQSGRFREDLYYRINVIHVEIAPLRARRDDILPLLDRFIEDFARVFDRPVRGISSIAQEMALNHDWPGNVRELKNRVERAVALSDGGRLNVADLFPDQSPVAEGVASDTVVSLAEARDAFERRHILDALASTQGRLSRTAEALGISRTTLWEKMRKHELPTDSYIREE